jgi:hypothetical protein
MGTEVQALQAFFAAINRNDMQAVAQDFDPRIVRIEPSEVHLAWMHQRPLLPLVGCGGWSDELPANPPDDRASAPILPWHTLEELELQLRGLSLGQRT